MLMAHSVDIISFLILVLPPFLSLVLDYFIVKCKLLTLTRALIMRLRFDV